MVKNIKGNPDEVAWIADERRLCVALSRAKGILCLVGAFRLYEDRSHKWNKFKPPAFQALSRLMHSLKHSSQIAFLNNDLLDRILNSMPYLETLSTDDLRPLNLGAGYEISGEEEEEDRAVEEGAASAVDAMEVEVTNTPTATDDADVAQPEVEPNAEDVTSTGLGQAPVRSRSSRRSSCPWWRLSTS